MLCHVFLPRRHIFGLTGRRCTPGKLVVVLPVAHLGPFSAGSGGRRPGDGLCAARAGNPAVPTLGSDLVDPLSPIQSFSSPPVQHSTPCTYHPFFVPPPSFCPLDRVLVTQALIMLATCAVVGGLIGAIALFASRLNGSDVSRFPPSLNLLCVCRVHSRPSSLRSFVCITLHHMMSYAPIPPAEAP